MAGREEQLALLLVVFLAAPAGAAEPLQPAHGARSGRGSGIKARVKISDNQIRVIVIVKLYKRALRQELASLGVIPKRDPDDSNNLAILICPAGSMKKSPHRETVEALLADYFLESGWKADFGCQEAPGRTTRAAADVFVVFDAVAHRRSEGEFQSIAFSVNLIVRRTSGALLASGTALSAPRAIFRAGEKEAAVREATLDAALQIEKGLEEYSRELAKKRSR